MKKFLSILVLLTLLMSPLACAVAPIPEPVPPPEPAPVTSETPGSEWIRLGGDNYIRYFYDETHGVCIWVIASPEGTAMGVLPRSQIDMGSHGDLNLEIIGID